METQSFATRGTIADLEETDVFAPKFDGNGLMPAVAVDAVSGQVLVLAYMNSQALQRTIETGEAYFWSRSRQSLWRKGDTSGEVLQIEALLTDCDQDAIVLRVNICGRGAACHTGRVSCFYRQLEGIGGSAVAARLADIAPDRLFDPDEVYNAPDDP